MLDVVRPSNYRINTTIVRKLHTPMEDRREKFLREFGQLSDKEQMTRFIIALNWLKVLIDKRATVTQPVKQIE